VIKSFSKLIGKFKEFFMKKLLKIVLCVMLATVFCLGFTACKNDDGSTGNKNTSIKKKGDTYVLNVYATSYDKDGNAETVFDADDLKYTTKSGDVVDVTIIGANAFKGNDTLETIVIPSTVTEIGAGAFAEMTALKTLELPFAGSKLDAINEARLIGYLFGTESYEGGIACTQTVSPAADSSAQPTTSVYYLPQTLTTIKINYTGSDAYAIPQYAFSGLSVNDIQLLGNINKIGNGAFTGSYIYSIDIPATVTEIGDEAFASCPRLTDVDLTGNTVLASLGDKAFYGFKGLSLTFPASLSLVGDYCFADSALTSCTIPNGNCVYGVYPFNGCDNLAY
jgi:hypothetical protein